MRLENKTVVLTGATGGIGRCMAHALANKGSRMLLVGRNAQALEHLRSQLPAVAKSHLCIEAQLQDSAARATLANACIESEVDVLINNAGASEFKLLEDSDAVSIANLIALNLTVPIQLTQAILPHLKLRPEAAVINIGSAFGAIAYPGFSVYSASKFGLRGFSEALRRELGDSTVRVMHLAPRATKTELNSATIVAMNARLGTVMDEPELVAKTLIRYIETDKWESTVMGWPESFYAKLNGLFPNITNGAIAKQLSQIKYFAQAEAKSVLKTHH